MEQADVNLDVSPEGIYECTTWKRWEPHFGGGFNRPLNCPRRGAPETSTSVAIFAD
jgi:hypothetical protein